MKSIRLCAVASLAAACVITLLAVQPAQAQTYKLKVLWPFAGDPGPANPYAGLAMDTAGNLYGTTYVGGNSGGGTVFEVTKAGNDTVVHNFTGPDGVYPYGGVTLDAAGNLYGTTSAGGAYNNGIVFKLDTTLKETVLYSFTGTGGDGCNPEGGLLLDTAGNLYGTTYACGVNGYGTIFKLTPSKKGNWTETVLHSFDYSDGANPYLTNLLMDSKGNLYGVAFNGGGGFGTVYKLSNGTFALLYSFTGGTTDGCYPSGVLSMDAKGNLYGTAVGCGMKGDGIVWKVSPKNGTEKALHNFAGGPSDGANPYGGVIRDAAGNLYGTTHGGGASNSNLGTVFELSPKRKLTLLHSFASSDGTNPYGWVVRNAKGDFYGTTFTGGTGGYGTVWDLTK